MASDSGRFYENKAVEFLKINGYKIIKRNFRSRFGEIDIIARDNDYICFVEVKMRSAGRYYFSPQEAVDVRKRSKIKKTALLYAANRENESFRFDILQIFQGTDWRQYDLIKNAFSMDD